jgi:hypothetical protein
MAERKGLEGTMRDAVEVYCPVISRNYGWGVTKTKKCLRLV